MIQLKTTFGDEVEEFPPKLYLNKTDTDHWTATRAALSPSQIQENMIKRNNKRLGIKKFTDHESFCKVKPCGKAYQKQQQMITKELFLTWDGDGEGSLSQEELISAFIRIGLSSDH